jgi:GrpB-like predicted nucleotidyltransferase (UPF0157 family)
MKANKKLSKMSNEELWHLFPIVLTEHNDSWEMQYREEEKRIRSFLKFDGIYISHIGSTSIKSIWAKPIVDILLEIPPKRTNRNYKRLFASQLLSLYE